MNPEMKQARAIAKRHGRATISLLNREMDVGYARCAQLVQELERRGVIDAEHVIKVPEVSRP